MPEYQSKYNIECAINFLAETLTGRQTSFYSWPTHGSRIEWAARKSAYERSLSKKTPEEIDEAIDTVFRLVNMSPRAKQRLAAYYGLEDGNPRSAGQIGDEYGLSTGTIVNQIRIAKKRLTGYSVQSPFRALKKEVDIRKDVGETYLISSEYPVEYIVPICMIAAMKGWIRDDGLMEFVKRHAESPEMAAAQQVAKKLLTNGVYRSAIAEKLDVLQRRAGENMQSPVKARTFARAKYGSTPLDWLAKNLSESQREVDARAHEEEMKVRAMRDEQIRVSDMKHLGLSTKSLHALRRGGVLTIEQLEGATDEYLLKIRQFGPKMLQEVRQKQRDYRSGQQS